MPFGLCNAAATFQRLMYKVIGDQVGKTAFPYQDDIIIYADTLNNLTIVGKINIW